MMERNKMYLILLIVVIVGLVAIFSLAFLMAGDQNVVGAAAWGGGGEEYDCWTASGDVISGGCGTHTGSVEATRCRNAGGTCHAPQL